MNIKQNDMSKETESKISGSNGASVSIKDIIDQEIKAMLEDEIQSAVRELVEEQKAAIRQVVGEYKKTIEDQLVREKALIWADKEDIRKCIMELAK